MKKLEKDIDRRKKGGRLLSGGLFEEDILGDFGEVSSLDLGMDTIKTTTDSLLGRRKDHLVLDRGIIGGPNNKTQLVPHAFTTGQSELKVVHSPSAVLLGKLSHKAVKVLVLRGLENDDGSLVLRETIDDIGELLASLELLELFETFLGRLDTGGHFHENVGAGMDVKGK